VTLHLLGASTLFPTAYTYHPVRRETTLRVWDRWLCEGRHVFREMVIGALAVHEARLLRAEGFENLNQLCRVILMQPPESMEPPELQPGRGGGGGGGWSFFCWSKSAQRPKKPHECAAWARSVLVFRPPSTT
jgi:hypothetical protein